MTRGQQFLLVALRTIIGWHFAYEGYFKLITPGWGPDGQPLSAWSSAAGSCVTRVPAAPPRAWRRCIDRLHP